MTEETSAKNFIAKFTRLTESNKKYVIAIQQALMYAQSIEKDAKEKQCEKIS